MRAISCMLTLALLCTTGTGCALFKKNPNNAQPPGIGAPPAKFPGAPPDPLVPTPPSLPPAGANAPAGGNSILAGTIIDAYHRPIGNAYVRWVSLDEKDTGAPIDVAADAHGHFIIQGVRPGGSYKLIARTKQGDKLLAGMVLTSAPDVRVVIPIREDLVNGNTPPLPSAPTTPAATVPGESKNTEPGQATKPTVMPTINVPAPPTAAPTVAAPAAGPNVAETPKKGLPMLTIPKGPRPELPRPPALPGDSKLDTGPTRVPSCALLGNHLENLALKDSKGQTWEYKKDGAGKLILIDFWGTHCIYCRDSMPTLNRLKTQYGSRGLEVVGIAIEAGKDERKEADAVNKMCSSMQLSYRQLMGHVGAFDAGKSFKIEGLPTLILLSEQGDIIWHHVGRPDPALLNALERTIQSRLNNRTF